MQRASHIFLSSIVGFAFAGVAVSADAQVVGELEAANEEEVLDIAEGQMLLRLSLTNTTDIGLLFLVYQTPLAGFENDLFVVDRDGEPIDYIGRMVLRAPPTKADWIRLEPGETLSMVFDLATAYDITQPGVYRVRFRGVPSVPDTATARSSSNYPGISEKPESNTISLLVVGSPLTEPRAARSNARFFECTPSQLEQVYAAEAAVGPAADAAAETALTDPGFVVTWFGRKSFANYVADHFSCISSRSSRNQYFCDTCDPNVIAYTYLGGGPIFLCQLYFNGGFGAGTILHEVSHHCNTIDNGYGCGTARQLARNDPYAALDNADNYRCAAGLPN